MTLSGLDCQTPPTTLAKGFRSVAYKTTERPSRTVYRSYCCVLRTQRCFGDAFGGNRLTSDTAVRADRLPAVPARVRFRRRRRGFRLVQEPGLDPQEVVSFPVGRVVVCFEHPFVAPAGDMLDYLVVRSRPRQTGDGRVSEVMRIDGFVDARTPFAFSEHVTDSVTTHSPTFGIVAIVAPEHAPKRSLGAAIYVMVVEVVPKLGLAIVNGYRLSGATL